MSKQVAGNDRNASPQDAKDVRPCRRGRPRTLDEEKRGLICALIAVGVSARAAAQDVGCAPSTIRREARHNPQFRDDVQRAKQEAECRRRKGLNVSSRGWRASARWLERRQAESWAPMQSDLNMIGRLRSLAGWLLEIQARVPLNETARKQLCLRLTNVMSVLSEYSCDPGQSWRPAAPTVAPPNMALDEPEGVALTVQDELEVRQLLAQAREWLGSSTGETTASTLASATDFRPACGRAPPLGDK
jgi:hypothetical protein